MAGVGAVVMGAATYEIELGWEAWPYDDRPTFVFTNRAHRVPDGADVRFVSGPVARALPVLDAATDSDMFLVGGADLARQFLEAGTLDELHLFSAPLLLGGGTALFDQVPRLDARLLETTRYSTGIVGVRYAFEG